MEQPAAGVRSDRMGLAVAAFRRRRKADAVLAPRDERASFYFRQMVFARQSWPDDRLLRHCHDAKSLDRCRRTPHSNGMGHCDPAALTDNFVYARESKMLDGN